MRERTHAWAEPITHLGEGQWWLVPLLFLTLFFAWRRRWSSANRAGLVFWSVALAGVLVNGFKVVFGRSRPKLFFHEESVYDFSYFTIGYDYAAYPSGHSAVVGAAGVATWLVSPNWVRVPVVVLTVAIAISRVLVTSHWPADVLAGYLMGGLCAVFLHWRFVGHGWLDEPAGLFRRSRAPRLGSAMRVSGVS